MDLRRIASSKCRHINRRLPLPGIPRRQPDIYQHDDGTVSLAYLTRSQAWAAFHALSHCSETYAMARALGDVLGVEYEGNDE